MSIVPGLIDAHTHPVWDGDRVHEFAMKVVFLFGLFSYYESKPVANPTTFEFITLAL
jgi:cytosine/adenosine deaminase-related metal-dependent hydrolase